MIPKDKSSRTNNATKDSFRKDVIRYTLIITTSLLFLTCTDYLKYNTNIQNYGTYFLRFIIFQAITSCFLIFSFIKKYEVDINSKDINPETAKIAKEYNTLQWITCTGQIVLFSYGSNLSNIDNQTNTLLFVKLIIIISIHLGTIIQLYFQQQAIEKILNSEC